MPRLKIGLQLAHLPLRFKKALQAAAEMGVDGVEIDARGEIKPAELSETGLRQLRNMLSELNLRVSAVSFQTRRGYDVEADLERRIAATKAAMKFAHAVGAAAVLNQIGRIPAEPKGRAWDLLVQSLTDLSIYGQHVGAVLAATTGTEGGDDLSRLLAVLPPGGIGVDLDPGELIVNDFAPADTVTKIGSHIVHVHAKDGVRDLARGRGISVPLGRGAADFPALLGSLEELGYRGYLTVGRPDADDPLHEFSAAVQYLKSM